jgi:hypothetical protein
MCGQRLPKVLELLSVPYFHSMLLSDITNLPGAARFYLAVRPYLHSNPGTSRRIVFYELLWILVPNGDLSMI